MAVILLAEASGPIPGAVYDRLTMTWTTPNGEKRAFLGDTAPAGLCNHQVTKRGSTHQDTYGALEFVADCSTGGMMFGWGD